MVVQRVADARVRVEGRVAGDVERGLVVLLGVASGDNAAVAERLAGKVARLRIFENDEGQFDRSVVDVGGAALVVSQFTLIANTAKGNRPSFVDAAPPEQADRLAGKLERLRIFEDADGKMNLSVRDVGGELLCVSQFTLYGDARKGNRPSFVDAAAPEQAEPLYERVCDELRALGIPVETGVFGARMELELVNDGPVTIVLDT